MNKRKEADEKKGNGDIFLMISPDVQLFSISFIGVCNYAAKVVGKWVTLQSRAGLGNFFLKIVERKPDLSAQTVSAPPVFLRVPLSALCSVGARGTTGHLATPHLPSTSLQLRHPPPPPTVPLHCGQAC